MAGKNLVFYTNFKFFFIGFNLQMLDTKLRPTIATIMAKIRPCERHKEQFIFEYHLC